MPGSGTMGHGLFSPHHILPRLETETAMTPAEKERTWLWVTCSEGRKGAGKSSILTKLLISYFFFGGGAANLFDYKKKREEWFSDSVVTQCGITWFHREGNFWLKSIELFFPRHRFKEHKTHQELLPTLCTKVEILFLWSDFISQRLLTISHEGADNCFVYSQINLETSDFKTLFLFKSCSRIVHCIDHTTYHVQDLTVAKIFL